MTKKGEWKPMDDRHKNDRVMITHTGYIVDTETDCVFLSVQGFISWVNRILEGKDD